MATPTTVLFVCTGNIFRSMTAEYALRMALGVRTDYGVHSAGLIDAPHEILPFVKEYLLQRGIDIAQHEPRKLTMRMLAGADMVIAMDTEHRQKILGVFGQEVPTFSEVAFGTESRLPDVCEVVPNWRENETEAKNYGWAVMDTIFAGADRLLERLQIYAR